MYELSAPTDSRGTFVGGATCVEIKFRTPHAIVVHNLTHWLISTRI